MSSTIEAAAQSLENIYNQGDIDWISFGEILGEVSYAEQDISYGKSNEQRITDALSLIEFLCLNDDFEVGTLVAMNGKTVFSKISDDSSQFRDVVVSLAKQRGLDSVDVNFKFWLNKRSKGMLAPRPTPEVACLFKGARK